MSLTKEEITDIRKNKLNLTQVQFAQLFGVHPLTVSKWERGDLRPTAHQQALMDSFRTAGTKQENIGEQVAALLVTAGIAIALFALLDAAHGKKK